MKKIAKYLVSLAIVLTVIAGPAITLAVTADQLGAQTQPAGLSLGAQSPMQIATNLLNTAMLFLGMIAVCIMLLAGFKWMTAMGSEEKITEAKKLMSAGVIGIIIILSAWGITSYIITQGIAVTSTGTGTTGN